MLPSLPETHFASRPPQKPSFLKTYALKSLKFCQRFFIWEQMHIVTHAARSNNDAAATA